MIIRSFADLSIRFKIDEELIDKIKFPENLKEADARYQDKQEDITVIIAFGNKRKIDKDIDVLSNRGNFFSFRQEENICWAHPEVGIISTSSLEDDTAEIIFPEGYWKNLDNPFEQVILPALLPLFGKKALRLVHASAVNYRGSTTLVVGSSKSGKSTFTIKMLESEAKVLTDDEAFIKIEDGRIRIFSLESKIQAGFNTWQNFSEYELQQVFNGKYELKLDVESKLESSVINRIFLLSNSYKTNINKSSFVLNFLNYIYHDDSLEKAMDFSDHVADNCKLYEYFFVDDIIKEIKS